MNFSSCRSLWELIIYYKYIFVYTEINDIDKYSFIYATLCDDATQCDAKNESISKKRPLRELCVLASHSVASSHSVAFKKDIMIELLSLFINLFGYSINSLYLLYISFIDATHCDVATQCDRSSQSISKKATLREFCSNPSHSVASSHSVAFKKDIILELFSLLS